MQHNEIFGKELIQTVFSRVKKATPVSRREVDLLICSMKSNFIHDYLIRYKRWPLIEIEPGSNSTLPYCRFNDLWITDKRIPSKLYLTEHNVSKLWRNLTKTKQ